MALDLSDDDELGEFIYRTSQTAKLLREKKKKEDEEEKTPSTFSDIQCTTKRSYCSKRKREAEEINESVQKAAECSVEECTGKALDSGKCWKHKGYKHCNQDGCTKRAHNQGVCRRHGADIARVVVKMTKTCSHEGCTNKSRGKEGVCIRHGASWTKKTCSHERCTNYVKKDGVCIKHGAVGRRRPVAMRDVRTKWSMEEFVSGMGQK